MSPPTAKETQEVATDASRGLGSHRMFSLLLLLCCKVVYSTTDYFCKNKRTQITGEFMPNMWSQMIGRVCLLVHTQQAPADSEWDACLVKLGAGLKKFPNRMCGLVFTDGGSITASQRKVGKEILGGYAMPLAVLSGALIPRFVVASVSLFNKSIRSFTPTEFSQACNHLQLDNEEIKLLRPAFAELQQKMLPSKVQALELALAV
jgi:hypothetical protein